MANPELQMLATGVYGWLQTPANLDAANAGVVVDGDGLTVIDSLLVPAQAEPLAVAAEALGLPVRRLVLTSSHIEFAGGSSAFARSAVYGTPQASAHLDQPPNLDGYRSLFPDHAEHFDDLDTRRVTHIVDRAAQLTPSVAVHLVVAEMAENLVVHVPAAGVLFAGAVCSFGVTPLAFDGDPAAWADSLDAVAAMAETIVPGIGPVGGTEEVRALQAYLRACVDADGDPGAIPAGPWDSWPGRDLDAVNVERASMLAAGDPSPPPSMLRLRGMD